MRVFWEVRLGFARCLRHPFGPIGAVAIEDPPTVDHALVVKSVLAPIRDRRSNPAPASNPESGFTLIELLITIVILGVLATVVVFGVANFRDRAETATVVSNCTTFQRATAAFMVEDPMPTDEAAIPAWVQRMLDSGVLQFSDSLKTEFVTSFNAWVTAGVGVPVGTTTVANWTELTATPINLMYAGTAYCGG